MVIWQRTTREETYRLLYMGCTFRLAARVLLCSGMGIVFTPQLGQNYAENQFRLGSYPGSPSTPPPPRPRWPFSQPVYSPGTDGDSHASCLPSHRQDSTYIPTPDVYHATDRTAHTFPRLMFTMPQTGQHIQFSLCYTSHGKMFESSIFVIIIMFEIMQTGIVYVTFLYGSFLF